MGLPSASVIRRLGLLKLFLIAGAIENQFCKIFAKFR